MYDARQQVKVLVAPVYQALAALHAGSADKIRAHLSGSTKR